MKFKKHILWLVFIVFSPAFCQVTLPKLISDGMVLQREANVKIWGWAAAGEEITIHFNKSEYSTTTDENGDWQNERALLD